MVNDRLEQVYKGLGEMQNLATGVGDLKKVLSNVKTRGVLGEIQLERILEQFLSVDIFIICLDIEDVILSIVTFISCLLSYSFLLDSSLFVQNSCLNDFSIL